MSRTPFQPFLSSIVLASLWIGTIPAVAADDSGDAASSIHRLVPRFLLGLVHASEVHAELKLDSDQISKLEALFAETDVEWFPARNLASEEQLAVIDRLEGRVRQWFRDNTTTAQQQRMNQLEYFAQGNRILLRTDVAKQIGLAKEQQSRLAEFAAATSESQTKLSRTQYGDPAIASLQAELEKNTREERAAIGKIVRPEQRSKLNALLGVPFDPSGLQRIYAMAPEFDSGQPWINSEPLTMSGLRGKVVIVHFYAFQCHNCHANFDIYRRWFKKYSSDDVVLIGIQTPETSRERDADAVRAAATEKALDFPIQIDLASQTWAAWGNTMWPTVYVVDQNGYIRHWWSGELNWKGATADQTIESVVDKLLDKA
ncbi:Thiol-disulfide oxidoreductase YkuV [Rubripirellula tenax]|uniref:Thiol-disulfide oxidoreductase YkuV n=1 Tax=Rubripirellula tenax TaxID=2528015 RepID=A0A5C6EL68_9BACT|nr:redoxin domain-containing protein [Rubripirellula tenax]TWU48857.1 Thiol-disulfide oxidoreductase YkuV [Rubripirellula tenax]